MNATQEHEKSFTVVVGVDYSELSALALIQAVLSARPHERSHIHVFHSFRLAQSLIPGSASPWVPAGSEAATSEAAEELRSFVERTLAEYKATLSDDGRPLADRLTLHVRFFDPAEGIAELAADVEADLIVVGTHGRRGLQRLLLGSVAQAVLRLAPCSVLVVRPRGTASADAPKIEPPCPRCVEARRASDGKEFWCAQHREHHGTAHTYCFGPVRSGHRAGLLIPLFR